MNSKVVARVDKKEITQDDVLRFLSDIGPELAMQFQSPEGIQKVVLELVNQELLYLDALENEFQEEATFKEILEDTRVALLKNYAVSKLLASERVTEEEVTDYYKENKENFAKDETVRASHILVDSEEEAGQVINEIDAGKSFEEAAREYSSCPSKDKGGDLGEFSRGQMVAEFEDAAFSMEEGSISQPVKTQFGYHVIKLVEKSKSGLKDFDEVKNEISQIVLGKKQQELYLKKINEIKSKYKVELIKN